jgi:Secretion system C-terminal sorting domain
VLWLYQYDTQTQQMQTIANYDWHQDPENQNYSAFGSTYLAADGKVYIATPQSTHYLHVIHNPDELGAACNFEARGVNIPNTTNSNLPNMPHFGLGALDGSPCDTLGYNQAKYAQLRIEPYHVQFQNVPTFGTQTQTVIARNIGDTTLIIQNPIVQQGIYTINLPTTIPAHSTAQATITCTPTTAIGSFQDTAMVFSNAIIAKHSIFLDASVIVGTENGYTRSTVKVYPNPTNTILNIEIPQNIKANAYLYNALGQMMKQTNIIASQTQLTTYDIPNGIYFLSVVDASGRLIGRERVVVQHE